MGHQPIWVGELDLACPSEDLKVPPDPEGRPYRRARILVREQGEPLGMVTVPLTDQGLDLGEVLASATAQFGPRPNAAASSSSSAGDATGSQHEPGRGSVISDELVEILAGDLPPISVVIGTRNRPNQVVECVELLLDLDYGSPIEVIIVDNGASTPATAEAVESTFGGDDRVRYLAETRPGLSRARNIGLAAARYPITAFLSDDIRVDRLWLAAIVRGFRRDPAVTCVTGWCPPLYLDTENQLLFEASMAWGTRLGFRPVLHRLQSDEDPLHPYRPGSFANGSNMAFDTEVFRADGGFDEALGPGTPARGGEDLDAPIRLLAAGGLVAYEPAMIGWHADRYDDRAFHQHMYTYGMGLTAFLTKHLIDPRHRRQVISRIPRGVPILLRGFDGSDRQVLDSGSLPTKQAVWHVFGRLVGPFAYLKSRRLQR